MKTYSNTYPKLLEYIGSGNWRLRWNVQEHIDKHFDKEYTGYVYDEIEMKYKPSLDEIKSIIIDSYNKEIDKQILSGCVWNDISI